VRSRLHQAKAELGTRLLTESGTTPPGYDPQHCPPGATQVLFHDATDQVRRSLGYFHPRPAPAPE
jgi:hypothetical protein